MNNILIRNWNSKVKEDDTVFHVGDFLFRNSPGGKEGEGIPVKSIEWEKKLNGKIIHVKGNHDCFSKDTRILTIKGYKYYNEIKIGDLIPTVNLDKVKVEIKPIKNIVVNSVDECYGFKNRTGEGLFSNNHRHLTMRYNRHVFGDMYKIKTSKEIWENKSFILLIDAFKSGNEDYNISDNELKLLAWIYTDGSIVKSKNKNSIYRGIMIWQSKIKFVKEIELLLKNLKLNFTKGKRKPSKKPTIINNKVVKKRLDSYHFYVGAKQTRRILQKLQIDDKYEVPSWLYRLSDRQIDLLITEMIKGNGTVDEENKVAKVIWGRKDFLSKILGLCVTHGLSANLIRTKGNDYYLCVHKRKSGIKQVYPNSRFIKPYNDIMWDVTVENHIIFTELNGKTLVTGNSNNSTKTIIESMVIKYGGKKINMVHDPKYANVDYELNFCGHVHGAWPFKRITKGNKSTDVVNVGVDIWNFFPVTFEEIQKRYRKWKKEEDKKLLCNCHLHEKQVCDICQKISGKEKDKNVRLQK